MQDHDGTISIADGHDRRIHLLWAKNSAKDECWLPLTIHSLDTMNVILKLWDSWLGLNSRNIIVNGLTSNACPLDISSARSVIGFIGAVHDIGKASPAFQVKIRKEDPCNLLDCIERSGLHLRDDIRTTDLYHSLISQLILNRNGVHQSISVIIGGHHGIPPTRSDISNSCAYPAHSGFKDENWVSVQESLLKYMLKESKMDLDFLKTVNATIQAQVLISGLLIMADWIASNEQYFPLLKSTDPEVDLDVRFNEGWNKFNILNRNEFNESEEYPFEERFGYAPRPFQKEACDMSSTVSSPGIMLIEAPTGEGKTEAALAAAEILMNKFGLNGIFFALPTQATANGIFPRVEKWMQQLPGDDAKTINLIHSRSKFNKSFDLSCTKWSEICQEDGSKVFVNQWFSGKKGVLSDFVIGTVDQVLMAGLKTKHLAIKHLGLSDKVIIIDECHAYDEYMTSYLEKALQWLGSYNVPVILMSATFPTERKSKLMSAHLNAGKKGTLVEVSDEYPQISYCSRSEHLECIPALSGRHFNIDINRIDDASLIDVLKKLAVNGGYIGIIHNTVARAQKTSKLIASKIPNADVHLLHSGYAASDRASREDRILSMLGHGREAHTYPTFIVGTQVLEQSLDLDFDVLFTDICPIDLLIQRIGRLHRHDNVRPKGMEVPTCYVLDTDCDFDKGTESVYGRLQLMNTRILLKNKLIVPDDVAQMIHGAYDGHMQIPDDVSFQYKEAQEIYDRQNKDRRTKAGSFQISSPIQKKDLLGWLENRNDSNEIEASATVRDTDGSIEVILVQRCSDGFYVPQFAEKYMGELLPSDEVPGEDVARSLAGCTIRLPHEITKGHIENVIEYLNDCKKKIPKCWEESQWLAGELFLILDNELSAPVMGKELHYDLKEGVMVR